MSLLSYKIVACTSEDRMHPVRELQDFHAQSRGWQSAHWCDFPQALVLRFEGRVMLQQVQVLSHQFKIASRVEILIGDMPPGVRQPANGAEGVEYVRLGHFSLDSNERSGFQARELKTVYVPRASEGCYLKLLLHKCHVNEHNLYNQIGLLAVRAIGTGPGASISVPVEPLGLQQQARASPPGPPVPHEVRGSAMDPAVVTMINELADQKQQAVDNEDFDEAKRLKSRVGELREIGVQLAEMEIKKLQAIENEDYDLAKKLKTQLNDMRKASGVPQIAAGEGLGSPRKLGPPSHRPFGGLGGPVEELKDAMQLEMAAAQARINHMANSAQPPPPPPPFPVMSKDILEPPAAPPAPPASEAAVREPLAPSPLNQAGQPPPLPRQPRAVTPPPSAAGLGESGNFAASQSSLGPPSRTRATNQADHEEKPVSRAMDYDQPDELPVGSISDLPPPEALAPAEEKDAAPLIDVFGEHLVQCLYAKAWSLRQHALTQMAEQLPNLKSDGRTVVHATCRVVSRACNDKMVQVYLAGMQLFAVLFEQPAVTALPRSEWLQLTQPLTPTLISKLGDGNHRVKDAAEAALIATCRLPQLGPQPVISSLLAPLKPSQKKDGRLQMERLGLLHDLIDEFSEPLREQMREIARSLKPALESSNNRVREKASDVALAIFRVVGDLEVMMGHLSNLSVPTKNLVRDQILAATGQGPPPSGFAPMQQRQGKARTPTGPSPEYDQAGLAGDGYAGADEFTCQFCGTYDPDFADPERLDMHYWKDCPVLLPCEQCGQIIEVTDLNRHLVGECDQNLEFRYPQPLGTDGFAGCPLCFDPLPPGDDAARQHLCFECPANPRIQGEPAAEAA